MKKTVIGFVSRVDPFHNRVAWSGTIYKLREAIELAGFEVIWIPYGTSISEKFMTFLLIVWNCTIGRKSKWLTGSQFRPIAKVRAKELDDNPMIPRCDYLFFPGGAQNALYAKLQKPIISLSDGTVHLMLDYYWFNVNRYSKKMALGMEVLTSQKAIINIRSSQWAIDSVINDCHCDKNNCFVLEFGPNLDTADIKQCSVYPSSGGGKLRVLFSGVNWNRKGGDIAVEVVERLRDRGIDAQLTVVGPHKCPKSCAGKDYVKFVGNLNKNCQEDYDKYLSLFEKSHILLLPTKAECSAIVFSEAAAAGLPCYTYLTGGVGNYIENGRNGYALPKGSLAIEFADQIIKDIHTSKLASLREGAFSIFKEKLSWEAWAAGFRIIMDTKDTEKVKNGAGSYQGLS